MIFMAFLLFQELVFHFVVISEEKHLPIDERLKGWRLKAHICQQNQVFEELLVTLRFLENSFFEIVPNEVLEISELTQNILIFVVIFGDSDVEVNKLVPAGVKNFIHEPVFISVPPERDEGIVILTAGILVLLI